MSSSDWSFDLLRDYDDRICEIARGHGLDWFDIHYEVCDYRSMIGHMSYHGMPTHYGHWSFGKSFERTHQMYNLGMEGLPYELIINSDPSIAYLMKENPAYLQILIMAHCVGHSDFFKNNRTFSKTYPQSVIQRMRSAKKRIQEYTEDPSIGVEEIEKLLDSAHAIQFQTDRTLLVPKSDDEIRDEIIEKFKENGSLKDLDPKILERKPLKPERNVLGFIAENGDLPSWKVDILEVVQDQARYFIPQIQTKIMNEGWASFWHYRICNELELPQEYHIPFLKSHNQVVRPHLGGLNPYHIGFEMFKKIEERYGIEECFIAREVGNDVSFLRQYLTPDDAHELGLFTFSSQKGDYVIQDISDDEGFKHVKETLLNNVGTNGMPVIHVHDLGRDGSLILKHEHDGRDLDLQHADQVIEHINNIWPDQVKLFTIIEGDTWEI